MIRRLSMIWMPVFACGFALFLTGCAHDQARPPERIVTVDRPVPVSSPCVPAYLGPAPIYPDSDEALRSAPSAAERYQLFAAGRPLRVTRLNDLETVVAGCPRAEK